MSTSYTTLQKALAILPKLTSMLSFLGSSMIISQVLQSQRNRQNSQQRLVCAMSCIDVTVSTVWFLTNFFVPPWSEEVAWASGNQATCNVVQGFIVQLSISAVFYNASLSLYYLVIIRYGFNALKIKRLEPWIHLVPLSLGLGTAITSSFLKLYNPANWDCWIAPDPPNCQQSYTLWGTDEVTDCIRGDNATIYQWAFFFGPLWTAILFITASMTILYRYVKAQDERMLQYDFRSQMASANEQQCQRTSRNTRQVWSQSVLYVGAFFVTWLFPTLSRLVQLCGRDPPMWLILLSGCFIPSQGFFNALVYFRLRYKKLKLENSDKSKAWIVRRIIRLALCCGCRRQEDQGGVNHRSDGMDLEARTHRFARLSHNMRSSFSSIISMTHHQRTVTRRASGVSAAGSSFGGGYDADEHCLQSMDTIKMRGARGDTSTNCAVVNENPSMNNSMENEQENQAPLHCIKSMDTIKTHGAGGDTSKNCAVVNEDPSMNNPIENEQENQAPLSPLKDPVIAMQDRSKRS